MNRVHNQRTSVATLLNAPIFRADGVEFGRVREFAVAPMVDASRVEGLVVRAAGAKRRQRRAFVPIKSLRLGENARMELIPGVKIELLAAAADFLLLERDLLDQQIIDVHGHKVVRVNDVDLVWEPGSDPGAGLTLRIAEVEVGTRGAVRRLLKGLPLKMVDGVASRLRAVVIPWEFVDLIDRDPSRRVRLKIEQDRLASMHPSDLADILEELAPAEREALFSSLDEEVAAEALEEVEPRTQKTLLESLDSERIAGIIEEMDPGAAADLLSELSTERSDAILEEMNEQDRHEVEELLEYEPDSAAGLMTTEYVGVAEQLTVADGLRALAAFEGDLESVTELFLVAEEGELKAVVPLSRLVTALPERRLAELHDGHLVCIGLKASGAKAAELFDKYNLRSLPVLDEQKRLAGVIRAEHVIAWLREKR
jgi:flagellar motility protein MotE (MotC chaperone)/sporulation protein YlmC with PRC-barrel domain